MTGILILTAPLWLALWYEPLITVDPVQPAEAIVVLAGDWKGERIMKACELASTGVAPKILVSGPMDLYGRNEADLAIEYAVKHGVRAESARAGTKSSAFSTEEERASFARELMARKCIGC